MGDRKNKISRGLNKLLKSKRSNHFPIQDVFLSDPENRANYFDSFYQAQLAETASIVR